jgi:hypothetical protein
MVIDAAGRLYVRDPGNGRILIMSSAGEELGVIHITSTFSTTIPLVVTDEGTLYTYERLEQGSDLTRLHLGMVPKDEDEAAQGEPLEAPFADFEPAHLTARAGRSMSTLTVPLTADRHWTLAPSGAMIGGISDDYSFEVHHPDGAVTRIVKSWEPVPVAPDEAAWYRSSTIANLRNTQPDWTWDGPEIPATKPAFSQFIADHSDRVWVRRPGPGFHVEAECNEAPRPGGTRISAPCWSSHNIWEVFDLEGRFLGGAELPDSLSLLATPYIEDDLLVAAVTDDFGTVMVKRYRIVVPQR